MLHVTPKAQIVEKNRGLTPISYAEGERSRFLLA